MFDAKHDSTCLEQRSSESQAGSNQQMCKTACMYVFCGFVGVYPCLLMQDMIDMHSIRTQVGFIHV